MRLRNIVKAWLPLAVATAAFCALVYVAVQQVERADANDPQIQMAEDAALALNGGAAVDSVVPPTPVDLSASLAAFVVIYDRDGRPLAGSGRLDGRLPDYPKGALDSALQTGENRGTWQPAATVRVASVVVPYADGFVMAGRSLREVERREALTEAFSAITLVLAWMAELAVILALELFAVPGKRME